MVENRPVVPVKTEKLPQNLRAARISPGEVEIYSGFLGRPMARLKQPRPQP